MNILLVILVVLTIFVYVRFYTEPTKKIEIIQPRLTQLNQSHLQEKSPIVISEQIVNIHQFIDTFFKYQYIKKRVEKNVNSNNIWQRVNSRYCIVFAIQSCILTIVHPTKMQSNNKYEDGISIKLLPNQLVIVPYRWWISVDKQYARISLEDIFSLLF